MLAAAVIGLTVYMAVVGLNQASAIAGIGAFFVAVIGLALAVAAPRPAESHKIGHTDQQMSGVVAGEHAIQEAIVTSSEDASQHMADVTAKTGSAVQRIFSIIQVRALGTKRDGDRGV